MSGPLERRVADLAADIRSVDNAAAHAAQQRSDGRVKPRGSLGRLEELGRQLAAIAGTAPPPVPQHPAVVVAAADHGVHVRGVTPWPQAITAAMAGAICDGKAAVNAIAATVGAQVAVLDVGIAGDPLAHPQARRARVRNGTADMTAEPAMTREEAAQAILAGAGLAEELVGSGVDLLVTGDMGIANTTASACLVAALTDAAPGDVTGRGTGIDDDTLTLKRTIVAEALQRHQPDPDDALGALAAVGGLEHAALVGVILSAGVDAVPVVLDGVIAVSAALVAVALAPAVRGYMIAGHQSPEPGARIGLKHLALEPLLDLGMRLGEGTGALCAVPLVVAAARSLRDMAAIEDLTA